MLLSFYQKFSPIEVERVGKSAQGRSVIKINLLLRLKEVENFFLERYICVGNKK